MPVIRIQVNANSARTVFMVWTATFRVQTIARVKCVSETTVPVARDVSRDTTAPSALSRAVSASRQNAISSQRSVHTAVCQDTVEMSALNVSVLKTIQWGILLYGK